jgi:predicted molibdopterin-dependent oxidoreductase YjgC
MSHGRIASHPLLGPLPEVGMVSLTVDGVEISARPGEPVAVALLANGIRQFRTMPKTGDARGGFCFAGRCSDCQMIVDGVPNVMTCVTPVREGMRVETQHGVGVWAESTSEAAS